MAKKKIKKKFLSPIITMIILIIVLCIMSLVLSLIGVSANQASIVNGNLETTLVLVKNIFSKEGVIYFFNNVITNFSIIEPLSLLILSIMAISICKASGLFKHLFTPLKKVNPNIITLLVVFIGIISSFIGEYSYIILIPLISVLYEYLDKNPVFGIITIFLSITIGYGTGIFYNYNDYELGILTQNAAIIDVDATYKYSLFSNFYIMLTSTVIITFLLTKLVEKYLGDRLLYNEVFEDEKETSNKAFLASLGVLALSIIVITFLILPNGVLLDNTQNDYIAKLFSATSPFNNSFMFLILLISSLMAITYGLISKNFKDNHDISWGYTRAFGNIGYVFVMLFLGSILANVISWTNIGTIFTLKLLDLINIFDFTGLTLIIVSFISIVLMSLLLPSSIEKWYLISPLVVPLFMRANLTPDFAQFLFKAADSVGKVLTPAFIYFVIMLAFIQKYNNKENKITLFNTMKLMLPIIIAMVIFWVLILVIWYVAGLPLGIGVMTTM